MDGNPNVTAQTILETLLTQRNAIIRCYQPELNRLGRYLSQTHGQARFDKQVLQRWLEYSELMPEVTETIPARHHEMPYRCLLKCISARLEGTRTGGQHAYPDVETFLGDIKLIAQSLENNKGAHAGLFGIRRLLQRIETFGFHLATLDARQDALLHREVMGELLNLDDWVETDTESRQQTLTGFLERVSPGIERTTEERVSLSVAARDTLAVFSSIRQARGLYGTQATGLFIISMTQGADDVLTALALARTAGLVEAVGGDQGVPLDIAPLLETVGDLEAGPKILDTLLESGYYRKHLEQRGNRQVIMIGYSDSNKDSGIASARWSLFEAQARLVEIGHQNGVSIQFFHGRGGTVSRGGGNLVKGIEGAPAGSVNGYLRVTEQGEVINQKYGVRPIALRNLELVTGATLRHGLGDTGQHADEGMCAIMNGIAANARSQYRKLVFETPAFIRFFRSATPIDVIERLAIGSRPASRRSGEGIENLRAIPWVFSWAQIRVGFPGVYGIGGALQRAIDQHGIESLRAMLKHWSFFQGLVNDVEMVLAKSELDIGRRYVELAMPETRVVFEQVMAEFDLARHHILEIKQSRELLADQRTLQRNIRLRNPYADPMHILQINLLHRWREGGREDDTLLHALKSTVNGIALAIQNTG
jgi:phosphoenolpyruvate carboxylase